MDQDKPRQSTSKITRSSSSLIIPFIITLLLLLSVTGYVLFKFYRLQNKTGLTLSTLPSPKTSESPVPTANLQTYKSKDGSFTFKYPSDFKEITPQNPFYTLDTPLVALQSSQSDLKAPNYLQESFIEVSSQTGLPVAKCYNTSDKTKEINGTVFYIQIPKGGNAAGNRYDTTLYRTAVNDKCFEIASTIHISTDGIGITAEKLDASIASAKTEIDQVLTTFQFTK